MLQKSQEAGEAGEVDVSMALAQQATEMQAQHDRLHKSLTAPERTMSVCDICGVFINSTDNDQRRQVREREGDGSGAPGTGKAPAPPRPPTRAELAAQVCGGRLCLRPLGLQSRGLATAGLHAPRSETACLQQYPEQLRPGQPRGAVAVAAGVQLGPA
mgnify:CR=1 FL=1